MTTRPPLRRAHTDAWMAGVCQGIANHMEIPTTWVRLGMVLLGLMGGAGVVVYLFFALTMVEEGAEDDQPTSWQRLLTPPSLQNTTHPKPRRRLPVAELLLGAALVVAGVGLFLASRGVGIRLNLLLPGVSVVVGVGLAWWLIIDRNREQRHLLPRILGALGLVALGVITFFVTAQQPSVLSVIGAALAVLAGVALAIAPWVIRVNRELGEQRAARARETERAHIAAHLHDSVLQTLAMIQQRSQPGSEISRLARSQEHELRQWLFTTETNPHNPQDAPTELRNHAAQVEQSFPVRFDVVAVGQAVPAPAEIIAAAKEAMANAAQHAGGQVMVYVETTPTEVIVEVNDRGPGFNVEELGATRFGVRESIMGRMARVGGQATIVPGPGGQGTSVRLKQQRARTEEEERG